MKTLRVAICVMLIVGVLAMSLSAYAVDLGDRVVAQEYLWCYYIYQFLHSIGIDVTYGGLLEYTQEVQNTIIDWVVDYIADLIEADSQPSNFSIAQWIAPWQADFDYWGNLRYNSTMLEDMEDFAEWLKSELSLVDNDTTVINPTYTVGAYNLYRTNTWYLAQKVKESDSDIGEYGAFMLSTPGQSLLYMPVFYTNGFGYVVMSERLSGVGAFHLQTSNDIVNIDTDITGSGISLNRTTDDGWHYGHVMANTDSTNKFVPIGGSYFYSTGKVVDSVSAGSDINQYMKIAHVEEQGDVEVLTTLIQLPSQNPNYAEGDGVVIIDGVPNYQVVNVDNVSVDNLPAVITQGKIPDVGNDDDNPGFAVPWQAINGLIQYVAVPVGAIMALVNESPVEGVIMLYALIGGMIIFGMIRIMREH